MKVRLDPARCQVTGYCVRLAPRVFRHTIAGNATEVVAPEVPAGLEAVVLEAETTCPTGAILVEDEGPLSR